MAESKRAPIEKQVSAGGVVYRSGTEGVDVALIFVRFGGKERWQLPKGLVDADESPAEAAHREVREETGLEAELQAPIDTIEYWYAGQSRGRRVRFHKFVHFFLFKYVAGQVDNHDHEVLEARWFPIKEAITQLAFKNEQEMVRRAQEMIELADSQ